MEVADLRAYAEMKRKAAEAGITVAPLAAPPPAARTVARAAPASAKAQRHTVATRRHMPIVPAALLAQAGRIKAKNTAKLRRIGSRRLATMIDGKTFLTRGNSAPRPRRDHWAVSRSKEHPGPADPHTWEAPGTRPANFQEMRKAMLRGRIKTWTDRGFGFIAREDGLKDVFVHCKGRQGVRARRTSARRPSSTSKSLMTAMGGRTPRR